MDYFYAQLNENNICLGISSLAGEVQAPNLIPIETYNPEYYRFRKYENGVWSTEKYEPISTAKLDDFNALKAENQALKIGLDDVNNTILGLFEILIESNPTLA